MAKKKKPAHIEDDEDLSAESVSAELWVVKLAYQNDGVVRADSESEAIEAYKELMGIKSSDHPFQADPLVDGVESLALSEDDADKLDSVGGLVLLPNRDKRVDE